MGFQDELASLRNSDSYAKMSSDRQYNTQLRFVVESFMKMDSFQKSEPEIQKETIKQVMNKTFNPVFENKELEQEAKNIMDNYQRGDSQAKNAMVSYIRNSFYNERKAMTFRWLGQIGDTRLQNLRAGIPGQYASSQLAVSKTRGADDNKIREQFIKTLQEAGDPEVTDPMFFKRIQRGATASRIAEGVLLGLVTSGASALITGAGAAGAAAGAAKAGSGAKAVLTALFHRSLPSYAIEAGLEGGLGVAEYVTDNLQSGELASVKGVTKSFGIYAGLDMAANLTLNTVIPLMRYSSIPFTLGKGKGTKITSEAIEAAIKDENTLGGLVDTANKEIKVHLKARQLYEETAKSLKSSADLEGLTEMQRLNYDGFEMGYSIAKDNGMFVVVPQSDMRALKEFDNLFEAKDWMANYSKNYPLQKKLANGNFEDISSYVERHNTSVKRQLLRTQIDNDWHITRDSKNFVNTDKRQFVSPEEFDTLQAKLKSKGSIIQYQRDINVSDIRSNKLVYSPTDDIVIAPEMVNNNGNAVIHVSSVASPEDWNKAVIQGQDAAAREIGFTPEQWAKDKLIGSNFQGAVDSKGNLHVFFPDRIKIITDRVDPATGLVGNIVKRPSVVKTNIKVTSTIKTSAKAVADDPRAFSELSHRLLIGNIDEESVNTFAKVVALKNNAGNLNFKINLSDSNTVSVLRSGATIRISLPKTANTAKNQKELYEQLLKKLDIVTGGSGNIIKYVDAFVKKQADYKIPLNQINKTKWVKSLIDDSKLQVQILPDGKGYQYISNTKKMITVSNIDDLSNRLIIENMEPGLIASDLAKQNKSLVKDVNDVYTVLDGYGKSLASGTDLPEILAEINYTPLKIPNSFAPKFTTTAKIPEIEMILTNDIMVAKQSEANAFLSHFEDYRQSALDSLISSTSNGNSLSKITKNLYQVDIPQLGHNKQFTSLKAARKYLSTDWKQYTNLQDAAIDKGMRLYMENGQYILRNSNTKLVAKTKQELYDQLSKINSPTVGSELVPPDIQTEFDKLGKSIDLPQGFASKTSDSIDDLPVNPMLPPKKLSGSIFDMFIPKRAAIQRNLKKLGDVNFTNKFNQLENHIRLAQSAHQRYVRQAFSELGNLDIEKRKGILYWIEADDAGAKTDIITKFGLSNNDLEHANNVIKLYEKLGDDLGIPILTRLKNYQPRIREFANKINPALMDEPLTESFYKTPIGREYFNNPEIRKFFARYERINDLMSVAREEDALAVFLSYSKQGHNELYLRGIYNDINTFVKQYGDTMDSDVLKNLFADYREAVTHSSSTLNQKVINKTMGDLLSKMGLEEKDGKKWIDLLLNASYMTNMSWRPWTPFRNIWQVYNVLPMKTGNINITNRAIKKFVTAPDKYLGEMLGRNIFPDDASFATQLQKLYSGSYPKGLERALKFGQEGLGWFKASDHATRVVAALSADDLMEQAYKKSFTGGIFNEGKFLKYSRLEVFTPDVKLNVLTQVKQGNKQAAKDIFAREMVNTTMFDYTKLNKPLNAKGVLGKLYYQYMTYPLNLASGLAQTMSNGSVSARVKSLAALGTGLTALGTAMGLLGIQKSQFMTWNQISFSGGPLWTDMIMLSQLFTVDPKTPLQREARRYYLEKFGISSKDGELGFNKYPQILPGRVQIRYWEKAIKAFDEGDWYRGFLYLTTTPVDKNWAEAR